MARDDRKVRIEVGRGLEGDLPDITCDSVIRKQILPRFKDGDYDAGVTDGIQAILGAMGDLWGRIFASVIFLVVVGVFTGAALFTKGVLRGSWRVCTGIPGAKYWFGTSAAGISFQRRMSVSPGEEEGSREGERQEVGNQEQLPGATHVYYRSLLIQEHSWHTAF